MKRAALLFIALASLVLTGCATGPSSPAVDTSKLDKIDLLKLLPTRDDVNKRLGSGWSQETAPQEGDLAKAYASVPAPPPADIATLGKDCAAATDALSAGQRRGKTYAAETYYDPTAGGTRLAGWSLIRLASAADVTASIKVTKTWLTACSKAASLNPSSQPLLALKSAVSGAIAYQGSTEDDADRDLVVGYKDILITVFSRASLGSADAMAQLQLDKLAAADK
ncbi:MAG TPA: hypothetical protein VGM38_03550 [Pseudolysinimonas sp.]|jgi:hypothetical protein